MSNGELRTSNGELQELLDFGVRLAREAGEITLRYFRREFETRLKGKDNFVTQADIEAEEFLRRRIAEEFPADAIIGEEGGAHAGTSGRRWIIDPIDGTYSFVHGVPFYGVLLGVEIDGEPSIGIINLPALDEIVYAAKGTGCFWNGERTHVSQTATLEDALLLCTDFGSCERHGFGPAADELQRRAAMRRTWGDCYGYVLVATGRADVMLDPAMNVWDCAALLPVVEEAGGTFTDWRGQRSIHSGNAVATNGILFREVMRAVETNR
ncbi:MAG TPA: histidinol-phosphatase [Pyrinomonadaceae bacterium]|jgi:histidinol phosphatase-like enzyme (inositol monophosphatase family)|nr:histidinol-phosphatase [Pyrinomonadaceae bacterium]